MFNTNEFFEPGKLSVILDAQAGSSGKGVIGSFVTEHADNWQFACNTFSPQAGHWVKLDDGSCYFYQTFNSCAYQDKYEMMYIGPGGMIELPAFFNEIEANNIPREKIGISPIVAVLQDKDGAFERGEVDLDGNSIENGEGTMKKGSTCHGAGACRARKILRRPDVLLARDVPELAEFICDVPREIMDRLDRGQSGLLEIAQGYQLSYGLSEMYPYCTSRNCTVAAGLDDMMIPPYYAGNVLLNLRTYPIRINNKKFIAEDGSHLVWEDIQAGKPHVVKEYNSGPGYDDQVEITWEELTEIAGSPTPIMECTSVTKLPRRVFTFSKSNLVRAIRQNKTNAKTYLSINFANYIDYEVFGSRGTYETPSEDGPPLLTDKVITWMDENIGQICEESGAILRYVGTGPLTDDTVIYQR
jgi:adenylosuccinate synthase